MGATENRPAHSEGIGPWRIGAFVLPALPISALGLPLVVYLPPFYVTEMGVSAAWIGLVFLLARFWDMFTDPPFGYFSDHYETRWGRRKPWIFLALPILMLSIWQIFLPPEGAGGWHLFFWLVLLYVGWTMLTISHMSWGAELSPDYHRRAQIQGWREAALIAGMIAILTLPALTEYFAPVGEAGLHRVNFMGTFLLIMLPVTIIAALTLVPGRPGAKSHSVEGNFSWREALSFFTRSPALRRLLFADVMVGLAPGINGALYIFVFEHVFQVPRWTSFLLLSYFVSGLLAVPLWIRLSGWVGKHRTLAIALFYGCCTGPFVILLPPGQVWWFFALNVTYGAAYGAGLFLLRAIMADFTDLDHLVSGKERTGLCFSLLNMTNKIGYALSVGIAYPLLNLIGFNAATGAENTAFTLNSLLAVYVGLPFLFAMLGALAMWNFPIDKGEQERTRAQLQLKKQEGQTYSAAE